jgi:hypothetical protein
VKTYRLLFSNVLGTNNQYEDVLQLIRSADADIVLLVRSTYDWFYALNHWTGLPASPGSPGAIIMDRPFKSFTVHLF